MNIFETKEYKEYIQHIDMFDNYSYKHFIDECLNNILDKNEILYGYLKCLFHLDSEYFGDVHKNFLVKVEKYYDQEIDDLFDD